MYACKINLRSSHKETHASVRRSLRIFFGSFVCSLGEVREECHKFFKILCQNVRKPKKYFQKFCLHLGALGRNVTNFSKILNFLKTKNNQKLFKNTKKNPKIIFNVTQFTYIPLNPPNFLKFSISATQSNILKIPSTSISSRKCQRA